MRRARLYERENPLQFEHRPNNDGRPGGGRRRRSRRHRQFGNNPAPQHFEQFPQAEQPLPQLLTIEELSEKSKADLNTLAKEFDIDSPLKLKKEELIPRIMEIQAQRTALEVANGVLDILPEGYGFLRRDGYVIGPEDVYVSQTQIRRFELRRGDLVEGQVRRPKDNEKYFGLIRVDRINGLLPDEIRGRRLYEKGTPIYPNERFQIGRAHV